MFITVFSAVLGALLVYWFLTKATTEQKAKILSWIKWIFIIGILLAIVGIIISLIYSYRSEIINTIMYLLLLLLVGVPCVLCYYFVAWNKFRSRKKLGLIKDGVKLKDFNEEFEKKRYENLTKQQKEIEDKRSKKSSKLMLRGLIVIPLILIVIVAVFIVWFLVDNNL